MIIFKTIQCNSYQIATQRLCSTLKLHFDPSRHVGPNMMSYEGPTPSGESSETFDPE